jgi:hypothetical protein
LKADVPELCSLVASKQPHQLFQNLRITARKHKCGVNILMPKRRRVLITSF